MIPFFDVNSGEFIIIAVLALLLIGPRRLAEYTAKLREWIVIARNAAENAKTQLAESSPEFADVDWKHYDPRQYDPRRIVREALFDDPDADIATVIGLREPSGATRVDDEDEDTSSNEPMAAASTPPSPAVAQPAMSGAPFDDEAT